LKIGGTGQEPDQFPLSGRWEERAEDYRDAATGDMRKGRNPSAGNDIFQRG